MSKNPTEAIIKKASEFPDAIQGKSCNQMSFKVGKASFLFIGPGPKGIGYKAMFKLEKSMKQAMELSESDPDQFQVGSTGWVTARFTDVNPLPKSVWEKWLKESYSLNKDTKKSKQKPISKQKSWVFNETKSIGVDYFDKTVVEQYDQEHEKFRNFDEEAAKISGDLGLSKESVILDFGCGTGGLTTRFSKLCKHVYAVDTSDVMIQVLKSKLKEQNLSNVTIEQAGLLSYEHTGETLDAVVANICLHHLPDFWKQIALNRINAILKPGGKLFLCDVVFSFDPTEYSKNLDEWIMEMRTNAGDQMADEAIVHVRDEYSTWDWIMSGLLEKANFRIDTNTEINKNLRIYLCTKT